jgi:hypothetical protein
MSRSKKPLYLLLLLSLTLAAPRPAAADPLPEVQRWCQAYAPAVRPLHAALDEALDSLGRGWGPDSHGLGYPLHEALLPVAALLPVPDPRLDRRLRRALVSLEEGSRACMRSMPMTSLLRLVEGGKALAELESGLAAVAASCVPACPPSPASQTSGCRSTGASLTLLVGIEGEGLSLADNSQAPASARGRRGGLRVIESDSDPEADREPRGSEKSRSRRTPRAPKRPPAHAKPRRSGTE